MAFSDWSTTAGSNTSVGGVSIAENMNPSDVNNAIRAVMADGRAALGTKGADIASATTTDLGAVSGLFHDITGTTTITGFGTIAAGIWKVLKFEGALTLTHNATSLILLGGQNRTTADGDIGIYVSEGSGNWREVACFKKGVGATLMDLTDPGADRILFWDDSAGAYKHLTAGTNLTITDTTIAASNTTLTLATMQASTSGTAIDFTSIPAGVKRITVMLSGVSTNGTSGIYLQIGDAGGLETTGYNGGYCLEQTSQANSVAAITNGFIVGAGGTHHGTVVLTLIDSATFLWACHGTIFNTTATVLNWNMAGTKALSAELDRLSIVSTDTFDAGSINIMYE